jgi:hypothetical protein
MIQIVGAILVSIWFFRSARTHGQSGIVWAFMGLCAFLGPSILLSAIINSAFSPGIPVDRIGSGFGLGLLIGLIYNSAGIVAAWFLHKRMSRILANRSLSTTLVLSGAYMVCALLQQTTLTSEFVRVSVEYAQWRPLTLGTAVDALVFALVIRLRRRVLPTIILWGLYCGVAHLNWLDAIRVQFYGGLWFLHIAIGSALMMLGLTLGLRLHRVTWLRFFGIVLGSYALRDVLWALYTQAYQIGYRQPLADLIKVVLGALTCSVPIYWAFRYVNAFYHAAPETPSSSPGMGDDGSPS